MPMLTTLLSTAAGKAAAAAAGLAVAGGGITVALDHAGDEATDTLTEVEERLTERDDTDAPDVDEVDLEARTEDDDAQLADTDDDQGRAEAVHEALVDGEDVRPGDEEFGQTVAEHAQEDGALGGTVSEAARDGAGEDQADGAGEEGRARAESSQQERGDDPDEASGDSRGAEAAEAGADNAERGGR